jgi:hypothetical protein
MRESLGGGDGVSQSGSEQGRDVIVDEPRRPVLYDAKNRPLSRVVGFRSRDREERETSK